MQGIQLIYNKPACRMSLVSAVYVGSCYYLFEQMSRGSECVLVKRHFFIKNTNPDLLRLFRTEVRGKINVYKYLFIVIFISLVIFQRRAN